MTVLSIVILGLVVQTAEFEQEAEAQSAFMPYLNCASYAMMLGRSEDSERLFTRGAELALEHYRSYPDERWQRGDNAPSQFGADFYAGFLAGTVGTTAQFNIYGRARSADGAEGDSEPLNDLRGTAEAAYEAEACEARLGE